MAIASPERTARTLRHRLDLRIAGARAPAAEPFVDWPIAAVDPDEAGVSRPAPTASVSGNGLSGDAVEASAADALSLDLDGLRAVTGRARPGAGPGDRRCDLERVPAIALAGAEAGRSSSASCFAHENSWSRSPPDVRHGRFDTARSAS